MPHVSGEPERISLFRLDFVASSSATLLRFGLSLRKIALRVEMSLKRARVRDRQGRKPMTRIAIEDQTEITRKRDGSRWSIKFPRLPIHRCV